MIAASNKWPRTTSFSYSSLGGPGQAACHVLWRLSPTRAWESSSAQQLPSTGSVMIDTEPNDTESAGTGREHRTPPPAALVLDIGGFVGPPHLILNNSAKT
jgi:hypothetical protein